MPTVLVVDDEKICLKVAEKLLNHLGIETVCSRDGREALSIYKKLQGDISCVLLDIQMPGLSGVEIFRRLKQLNDKIQVIIVSGFVNKENKDLIDPLGPVGYLEKPIDLPRVREMMGRLR